MKVCDVAIIINNEKAKISVSTPYSGQVVYSKENFRKFHLKKMKKNIYHYWLFE